MLSKCANPECSALFLYFRRGRLFRLETQGREDRRRHLGNEAGVAQPLRRIEFYWLCEDCAEKMTIAFDKVSGVSVLPQSKRPQSVHAAAQATAGAA